MKVKVAAIQMAVEPGRPEVNLAKGEALLKQAADYGVELAVMPEMWTTGFDWKRNAEIARLQEPVIDAVAELAKKYGLWLNGSLLTPNGDNKPTNTSYLFDPAGEEVARYSKAHLFSHAEEHLHITAGDRLTLADTPWGKVGLSVCYDLRFPEMFRRYALDGAVMILHPSAFPHPRLEHWKVLCRARAIENQLFFIAANYIGSGPERPAGRIHFFGHSCIVDAWGKVLASGGGEEEAVLIATLNLEEVKEIRSQIRVLEECRPDLYSAS